jgi:NAD(P)-dependent dehydrogenase (short-subunit alcohol dehydrogenase family)
VLDVNLRDVPDLRFAIPEFEARQGAIVTSRRCGVLEPSAVAYSASKGIVAFTRALALDHAPEGSASTRRTGERAHADAP